MKIAFVINKTHKEEANFSTTLMALRAIQRGHDIYYIGLADFFYDQDIIVGAHARQVSANTELKDTDELMELLKDTEKSFIEVRDLDILWLRYDPTLEMSSRPWAPEAAVQFALWAERSGVRVLNNPKILLEASNKLYLENFDISIRPKTVVTRKHEDVEEFFQENDQNIILKPIKGSGGKNVFLINKENTQNLKQTVEAIGRDGYMIAQEYLPEAKNGDIRFFLLNGSPIQIDGKYAAVRRVQKDDDIRSNVHQGGAIQAPEITEEVLNVVKAVSEQLKNDRMYLVGLDIVGDKIMEINVFSPGALFQAEQIHRVDFTSYILEDLEKTTPKKDS